MFAPENIISEYLNSNELCIQHIGTFTPDVMSLLFEQTEDMLIDFNLPQPIVRRIHYLVIEAVQNVYHHSIAAAVVQPIFALAHNHQQYFIITGNQILNSQVALIEDKIKRINQLDRESLTTLYREILDNGEVSDKGGSGLGFVEMKRKSRNALQTKFYQIDNTHSYFVLKITV